MTQQEFDVLERAARKKRTWSQWRDWPWQLFAYHKKTGSLCWLGSSKGNRDAADFLLNSQARSESARFEGFYLVDCRSPLHQLSACAE